VPRLRLHGDPAQFGELGDAGTATNGAMLIAARNECPAKALDENPYKGTSPR
jgi:hypothetical protein